ncbi:hypothetical protein LXL04_033627 [Taraxacum kok-saghyz]
MKEGSVAQIFIKPVRSDSHGEEAEHVRSDSHGDGKHSRHSDWDSTDQQNQEVVDFAHVRPFLDWIHDDNFNIHSDLVGAVDEMCGLSEEGMHTSRNNHSFDFSLLAGRTRENLIVRLNGMDR